MLAASHFESRVVLITGGTCGIGRATGLAFAAHGARVFLTHRWGSADEGELMEAFARVGGPAPRVVEADVSQPDDTRRLTKVLAEETDGVDVLVSNVCVVPRVGELGDHSERALLQTLSYSSWPLIGYLQALDEQLGKLPAHVVVSSSDGAERHYPGYDYVAIAKAVLESFVRYLASALRPRGVKINALRSRMVLTDSFDDMFGPEARALCEQHPELIVRPEDVARTTLALCSGALDAVSGQVLTLDRGAGFLDNAISSLQRRRGRD